MSNQSQPDSSPDVPGALEGFEDDPEQDSGRNPSDHPVNPTVLETVVDRGATVETDSVIPAPPTRSVASGRAEARERAIHLLYEREIKGLSVEDLLGAQLMPPDSYTQEVLLGVEQHQDELDALIGRLSRGWTLQRMPKIDLTILRVGSFELLYRDDIPTGVVLSEAAELATLYGGLDESGRFVNGVLAAAAREIRQ